ncbi:MAG: TonB-dependent receptor [Deltaproteobacteria bacterium]
MSAWATVALAVATSTTVTSTVWAPDQVLDPVEVRDTRLLPRTDDPSATTTVVAKQRLEDARRRGEDVADLVDQVPGVRVLDLGGPVAPRLLTVRGGSPAQSTIVVDGVVLRNPFATGFDPTLVHPEAIDHLEVVRGGVGMTYGDGALTGALVVDTFGGARRTAATATFGSLGTLRLSGTTNVLPVAIAASYERSNGRFTFVDRQVGLPDATFERDNNERSRATLSVAADRDVAGGRLSLRAGGALIDAGTPGLVNAPGLSGEARDSRRTGRVSAVYRMPMATGSAEVRVSGFVLDLDYRDPPNEITSDTTMTALTAEGAMDFLWGGGQLARVEVTGTQERASSTEFGEVSRGRAALAVTDEIEWGDVVVHGGVRAVHVGPRGFHLLPRVGAAWTATTALELRVGVGRALRTPALDELYHPPEVGFVGNPDLLPETAWEAELSAHLLRPVRIVAAVFARRIRDTILYLNRNAFVVRPENVGDADALGGELEIAATRTFGGFEVAGVASSSLLWSRLAATGARLPTQPVLSYAGQASVSRWRTTLFSAVRGFSRTFTRLRPADDNVVRAYFRWDAGLTVLPFDDVSIAVTVENLLDTRTLQTLNRYPLPGRTAFLTARWVLESPSTGSATSR